MKRRIGVLTSSDAWRGMARCPAGSLLSSEHVIDRPRHAFWFGLLVLLACGGAPSPAYSQGSGPTPPSAQLDKLVAPIALYPDPLVAQILPASTYPVQVIEADRALANGGRPSKATAAQWNPSIQALLSYPTVLKMMSDKINWTTQLGQAVAANQGEVMAAIQHVRHEAQAAGNLTSNDKQVVNVQGSGDSSTIVIEPANPQYIYVPQYNPVAILSPPPPYYYGVPGYGLLTFGTGFVAGAATAYACNWGYYGGYGSLTVNDSYHYNQNNVYHYNSTTGAHGVYNSATGNSARYDPRTGTYSGYNAKTGTYGAYNPATGKYGTYDPSTGRTTRTARPVRTTGARAETTPPGIRPRRRRSGVPRTTTAPASTVRRRLRPLLRRGPGERKPARWRLEVRRRARHARRRLGRRRIARRQLQRSRRPGLRRQRRSWLRRRLGRRSGIRRLRIRRRRSRCRRRRVRR